MFINDQYMSNRDDFWSLDTDFCIEILVLAQVLYTVTDIDVVRMYCAL